ncbi:serine hydrolase [bacterium]|nr:serine hydrolase [bacterium]
MTLRPHRTVAAALAVCFGSLAAPTATGQVPITDPPAPMILTWTPEQQANWYKAIEKVYEVRTVRRGDQVHALPISTEPVTDLAVDVGGKTSDLRTFMADHKMSGVLALKDGKIILEAYGLGRSRTDRWTSFSVAKSVTSTLVGAAIADGKIKSLDDPITDYLPDLKGGGYDGVTVRQIITMTSGVKWNEDYTDPKSDVANAGRDPMVGGVNPIIAYMAKLPREAEPGTKFVYKTGETDLAGFLVSKAVGKPMSEYLSEKIWRPYGMEQDAIWMVDGAGHERGGCCMSMTLRDYGRFAQFFLDGGMIDGRSILPEGWVKEGSTNQIKPPAEGQYGYFWWTETAPNFRASGIYGQQIAFFPEDRLIVVINSAMPKATDRDQSLAIRGLYNSIHKAATAN